jgi:hypothetical protein
MTAPLYSIPYATAEPVAAHGLLNGDLLGLAFTVLMAALPMILWRFRAVLAPYWLHVRSAHAWLARKVAAALAVGAAGALVCLGILAVVSASTVACTGDFRPMGLWRARTWHRAMPP